MNSLFVDLLDNTVVFFLDDMLIYSTTLEEHFKKKKILEKMFAHLCKYKFYYKLKKCSFLRRTITFLGFNITLERLQISDAKVRSFKE